jgi:hypothetical protein
MRWAARRRWIMIGPADEGVIAQPAQTAGLAGAGRSRDLGRADPVSVKSSIFTRQTGS